MAKRKAANGQGNIYLVKSGPNKGKYRGRLPLGRNPGTGKYEYKYFYHKLQSEVVKMMDDYKADMKSGVFVDPSKMTLGQ